MEIKVVDYADLDENFKELVDAIDKGMDDEVKDILINVVNFVKAATDKNKNQQSLILGTLINAATSMSKYALHTAWRNVKHTDNKIDKLEFFEMCFDAIYNGVEFHIEQLKKTRETNKDLN